MFYPRKLVDTFLHDKPLYVLDCYDYDGSKGQIDYDEFTVLTVPDTKDYLFVGYARNIEAVKYRDDFKEDFKGYVCLLIHGEEKYNFRGKERSQDDIEKFIIWCIDNKFIELNKPLQGYIKLGKNGWSSAIISGLVDKDNSQVKDAIAETVKFTTDLPEYTLLKGLDINSIPLQGKKFGGNKNYDPLSGLKAKEQFLLEKINSLNILPEKVTSLNLFWYAYNDLKDTDKDFVTGYINLVSKLFR